MTIEQLVCPMVLSWGPNFKKKLDESHISMTKEEIKEEFDKWFKENIKEINESIKSKKLNEKLVRKNVETDDVDLNDEDLAKEDGDFDERTIDDIDILNNVKGDDNNVHNYIERFYQGVLEDGNEEYDYSEYMSHIDVSNVTDMTALFAFTNLPNLDLSSWDTSNVECMEGMFYRSTFNNKSILGWDVSKCINFTNMFRYGSFSYNASKFWTPGKVHSKNANGDDVERDADLPVIGAVEDERETRLQSRQHGKMKALMARRLKEKEDAEKKSKMNVNVETVKEHSQYVVDFDTFVNEGKVKDFINKGIENIKTILKTIKAVTLKFGDFVQSCKDDGKTISAQSPYTTANLAAKGEIPGVKMYIPQGANVTVNYYVNDNVSQSAELIKEEDNLTRQERWRRNEHRNYITFCNEFRAHLTESNDVSIDDNMTRMTLHASDNVGICAPDIDTKELKQKIARIMKYVPGNAMEENDPVSGSLFIFGAPGVGKSTIPNAIINEWNKDNVNSKKSLMVIQCGDLSVDGMTLPIPTTYTVSDLVNKNPDVKSKIETSGIDQAVLDNIYKQEYYYVDDAPKSWLPVFAKPTSTEDRIVKNAIANGGIIQKKHNGVMEVTPTTEGGILLFDEFFRANEQVFSTIMQICNNRKYGDWELGDKWAIVCCSNRPNDDKEVKRLFKYSPGTTLGNRFGAGVYNFVPSFNEWVVWAKEEGHFDNLTIAFLKRDKIDIGGGKYEYTNWHNVSTGKFYSLGEVPSATPRSWSNLMNDFEMIKKDNGYKSILDIPEDEFLETAQGVLGMDMANSYNDYIQSYRMSNIDIEKLINDSTYKIDKSKVNINDTNIETLCAKVMDYLNANFNPENDPNDIPSVESLRNIYKFFKQFATVDQMNVIKEMHINIIRFICNKDYKTLMTLPENTYWNNYINIVSDIKDKGGYNIDIQNLNLNK